LKWGGNRIQRPVEAVAVGHIDVGPPITVKIAELDSAGAEIGVNASGSTYLGKGAIPIVQEQSISCGYRQEDVPWTGDKEIQKAGAVDISKGSHSAVQRKGDPCGFGDVGEGSVTVVDVQFRRGFCGLITVMARPCALSGKEQIDAAIVVNIGRKNPRVTQT